MNIKEIAELAGVSVSTVSKITNNKNCNVKESTRQKVLKIVEENNYQPYAKAISKSVARIKNVGVLFPDVSNQLYGNLFKHLEHALSEIGYGICVCSVSKSTFQEDSAIKMFIQHRVEGVFLFYNVRNLENIDKLIEAEIPYYFIQMKSSHSDRPFNESTITLDYQNAINRAVEYLNSKKFEQVALLTASKGHPFELMLKDSLETHHMHYDPSILFPYEEYEDMNAILDIILNAKIKSIIIENISLSQKLYRSAHLRHIQIPDDLSIIAFDDEGRASNFIPELTALSFPVTQIVESILGYFTEQSNANQQTTLSFDFTEGESVKEYQINSSSKIVVVGSINMDIIFHVDHLFKKGETVSIHKRLFQPGGKAANQAIGISKLNGSASIISMLGNDTYGKNLYENLLHHGVDVSGIDFDNHHFTGNAYIFTSNDAEYGIGDYSGVSDYFDNSHIDAHKDILLASEYCLIQTGIPMETVLYVTKICKCHNIKVILKPGPQNQINDQLLDGLYMIVPNEEEITGLIPVPSNFRAKADALIRKGVQHVILTLGHKGCYYTNGVTKQLFEPLDVTPVDTTGASDAFISALATFLAEGKEMSQAIHYANIAAGISVTRKGAQLSLPDRNTFEMYHIPL